MLQNSEFKLSSHDTIYVVCWLFFAIFVIISIVGYVMSYVNYKKKNESIDMNEFKQIMPSKFKNWWIKYRASGFLCLGVVFTLMSIGALFFILNELPKLLNS